MLRDTEGTGPSTPEVVERALLRCARDYGQASTLPDGSYVEKARRAERLAVVCERRARWWGVLLRWTFSHYCDLPWIFSAAVIDARKADESSARFWREIAADWHDEHDRRVRDQQPAGLPS